MKLRLARCYALLWIFLVGNTLPVSGFSLLGPYAAWQVNALAYQWPGADIGGPMNLGEGFRWNVPVITYACDSAFINYFGPEGVRAIDEAMQVFNDLQAPSQISADLSEYSVDTQTPNFDAVELGIIDLKSTAMRIVMEELGFADPIRYTFTLRGRQVTGTPAFTNYTTVQRNYDPQTLAPSRYVNGVLYGFSIQEFMQPFAHADAVEEPRTDLFTPFFENIPVATGYSRGGSTGPNASAGPGLYRTGLTRDDVGAIRYLYHPRNYAVESLLPGVVVGGSISPYAPFLGTNVLAATNIIVGGTGTNITATGLRGGRNKLKFRKAFYDPILSSFFTTRSTPYTDVVLSTNQNLVIQPLTRVITQPDIVFSVGDLGLVNGIDPVLFDRTVTAGWINNDALNGVDPTANDLGPGVIPPQVQIRFSSQLPNFYNTTSGAFVDGNPTEENSFLFGLSVWGSFDGSVNPPVIYPKARNISINQIRNAVLNGTPLP